MSVNHYGEGFNPSPEQRELVAQAYGLIDPTDPAVRERIAALLAGWDCRHKPESWDYSDADSIIDALRCAS